MLEQTIQALTTSRVILASASPRRYEIMKQLVIFFIIFRNIILDKLFISIKNKKWNNNL